MHFASDNAGPVHPSIMQALVKANEGWAMPYGNDDITKRATDRLRNVLEAPDATVFFAPTGTAANALILATLVQPFQAICCTAEAHIHVDECNAPEFYTGGAKLIEIASDQALMDPDALAHRLEELDANGVHSPQTGAISLTSLTERGTVYDPERIRALARIAHANGLFVHLDGARFANAAAALGMSPAELTWKAGIDALSFGGTKNGLMGAEACVIFDPAKAREMERRRHRAGLNFSKNRFLAAQFDAYLTDDLWLELAATANAAAQSLARGLQQIPEVSFLHAGPANMLFAQFERADHQRLLAAGAQYNLWNSTLDGDPKEKIAARLVCDWSCPQADIDQFVEILRR